MIGSKVEGIIKRYRALGCVYRELNLKEYPQGSMLLIIDTGLGMEEAIRAYNETKSRV